MQASPIRIPRTPGHWDWRTLAVYILVLFTVFLMIALAAETPVLVTKHLSVMTDNPIEQSGNAIIWQGCSFVFPPTNHIVVFYFSAPSNNSSLMPYYVSVLQSLLSGVSIGAAGADGYSYQQNSSLTIAANGAAFYLCVESFQNATFNVTEDYQSAWGTTW
jgi:hypothetical protein